MSHELVVPQLAGQAQPGEPETPPTGELAPRRHAPGAALLELALQITRAHDIRAALPALSSSITAAFGLDSVGFGIAPDGWIASTNSRQTDLIVPSHARHAPHGAAPTPPRHNHPGEPDTSHDGDWRAASDRTVRLPLIVGGARCGIMLATARHPDHLDAELLHDLQQITEILGAGLEREQHTADSVELPRSAAGARTDELLEILSILATVPAIDGTVQPVLARIASLFDAEDATLMITDSANLECYASTPQPINASEGPFFELLTAPIIRRAIGTLTAQAGTLAPRSAHRTRPGAHGTSPDVHSARPTAVLAVPLGIGGEAIGALVLERDNGRPFSRDERETAETVARHLSFSIERERRMRSYSQHNLLLSLVERVTASFARSTTADDLFARMAREIRFSFGYDCSIAMIQDNRLVFLALDLDAPEQIPDWVREGIPLEVGIMGRVARTGQPAFIQDVANDPAFLDTGRGSGSEIAVPIRVGDEVVGVLNVESGPSKPLESLDFEIMLILANHIGIALNNRQLIASERESRMAIEAIQRVSTIVAETLDPDESLRRIADTLGETMNYPLVTLAILEGDELILKANYGHNLSQMRYAINISEGVSGRVARTGQPVFIADVLEDPDYVQMRTDLTSEICVPIRCNGEIAGILNVEGTRERPLTERDLHLLTTFAEHAGVLLANALAYAALSKEATLDAMTGVPNLRYFQQQLQIELDHARRDHTALSLAVIDMDYLKHINDSYGHLVGDQVLRELARRMQAQLRGVDLLARYAGDEFVAILPGVDEARASEVARRLVEAARSTPLMLPDIPPIHLSISIGIATFPDDASTSTDLLRAADMAMYVAKESGKNRVSTARQSAQMRQRSER